jgi:hypothetical protein
LMGRAHPVPWPLPDRGRYGHIQDWTGHDVVARKTRIHQGCDYTGPVHCMPTPVNWPLPGRAVEGNPWGAVVL